jgi:hypothetical protein
MSEITHEERQALEQEERNLICDLSAAVSNTGDYRMIRCVDALVLSDKFWALIDGIELPYIREELIEFARARQAKRDRIKEIRKILGE